MSRHIINFPNLLSLLRILLTPLIVYAILTGHAPAALILLLIAGISDGLDGYWAKKYNQQTVIGSYLDPIADKIMLISSFIALYLDHHLPLFLFLAVIFRDGIILIGALLYELVTNDLQMQPTFISKATTLFQIIYLVAAILNIGWAMPGWLMALLLWITFGLTCVSGVHYMLAWTAKAVERT